MFVNAEENNLTSLLKDGFCVADFHAEGCGPCKMLSGVLARLESELPFITVVSVNTTACPQYAEEYDITAVPTLLFVKDGKLCERHVGFLSLEQLKEKIGLYLYN